MQTGPGSPSSIRYGRSLLNANPHQYPAPQAQSLDMKIRIPPELIFYIVGFLHDSKLDLIACSLCYSVLAVITRPLFFRSLRTNLESGAAIRLEYLLESGPEVSTLFKGVDADITNSKPDDCGRIPDHGFPSHTAHSSNTRYNDTGQRHGLPSVLATTPVAPGSSGISGHIP